MIYSAITGEKDKPRDDIKVFTGDNLFINPRYEARLYKTLFHYFIDDEYSIWVDGNVFLKKPEKEYYELLGDNDIAVLEHAFIPTIQQEIKVCRKVGKGEPEKLKEQEEAYKFQQENHAQTCMVIRRNTPEMRQLCETWWAHICRYSVRDQVSFPFVFQGKATYIKNDNHDDNEYYKREPHNYEDRREETTGEN